MISLEISKYLRLEILKVKSVRTVQYSYYRGLCVCIQHRLNAQRATCTSDKINKIGAEVYQAYFHKILGVALRMASIQFNGDDRLTSLWLRTAKNPYVPKSVY